MAQGSRHPTRADEAVPQGGDTVGYVQSEVCWNLRPDQEGWDDWTTFNTEDVESATRQTMNAATLTQSLNPAYPVVSLARELLPG